MTKPVPPFDGITEASIVRLVDDFYSKVRCDRELGPIFDRALAEHEWPAHLAKMYAFWSSVMLTSGRYKGDPVATHRGVIGIEPGLFARWLDLFETTAVELFAPEHAAAFAVKARRIAESLKLVLFFRPDRPWTQDLRNRPPLRQGAV